MIPRYIFTQFAPYILFVRAYIVLHRRIYNFWLGQWLVLQQAPLTLAAGISRWGLGIGLKHTRGN
jgi:hypothetical protein